MILINFIPIRLAGRDDANDFAALPITVTDDEHSHGDAQSQEHKPLFERRTPESRAAVPGRLSREGEQASVGVGFEAPASQIRPRSGIWRGRTSVTVARSPLCSNVKLMMVLIFESSDGINRRLWRDSMGAGGAVWETACLGCTTDATTGFTAGAGGVCAAFST